MNGRIYDASAGRFLSAAPFIAQTSNLQNYNRYSYVNNNPLSYTDPSGYFLKKLFKNKVFRAVVTIAVAYYTGGLVEGWLLQSGNAAFATTAGLTAAGKAAVGVASGFASGFVGSGGDLKSGLQAGLTGAAFGYAGTFGNPTDPSRYFAHAAAGCLSSALGGGDCDQGASASLAGKLVTNNTPQSVGGPEGFVAASVAGGTASVVTGGKFGNGAYTAAYGYLYNHAFAYLAAGTAAAVKIATRIFRGKADDAAEGAVDLAKGFRQLPFKDKDRLDEINKTLDRIDSNGPFPSTRDGIVFRNREGKLPQGNYREYTVETPGSSTRGSRRIVRDENSGSTYYTDDHYGSFIQIDPLKR